MTQTLIPVILAGGKGERFWPLSRQLRPKQFLSLDGSGISLLQATANRLLPLAGAWDNLWVITSALIAEGIRAQLPQLPPENLLIEPEGKDTAPAVAWATLEVTKRYGKEVAIGFFPADHWIGDQNAYENTIKAATQVALTQGTIVTLGITPNYPATGYGYIEQGTPQGEFLGLPVYQVTRFTEKPNQAMAAEFIETGGYSWNSGMFIFRGEVMLQELRTHAAHLLQLLEMEGKAAYSHLEKKSIDYAVMEKTHLASVLPANFGWDDLGDWNALERLLDTDGDNVAIANHWGQDTRGAIIYNSNEEEIIVTIGLEDVVIVRDGNATLVVKKERTQDIKQVLKLLQNHPQGKKLL